MRISYMKLYQDAYEPTHNNEGDAGLDFYSLVHCLIPKHEHRVMNTGIRIEVPIMHVGLLFPKGKNDHLLGAGVIDTYYEGEILFKVVNYSDTLMVINAGDPIGQMIFVPFTEPEPYEANFLASRDSGRGDSGGIKCGGMLGKGTITIV